ncbi:helix-turn-helix domain-containing protein [Saccharopolyspora phatthalungensis]|uniref:Transcriptional regulator with XRE-family HTH domain n=1 Tax=Saccharopolyspora phatthalungensis TaxID=664693 RepID=A0A840Q2U2_9PSEU|nr:helix-turn-helix transcriptional regulator [Saccharopolyspora phatthalungensis]MBB5154794.1 transcriptional regulator with XRE-family HTH domain [Saccharopolyspora phatthalungensis]
MADTPRSRALAKELRAARKAAGLTLHQLGEILGWSEAKISRIETARRGVKVDAVEALLDVLNVHGEDRERLLKMARDIHEPAWWELGRDLPHQLTALIDAEQRAKRITNVSLDLIPGLLQTRAYTRQIMEASGVEDPDLEDRVSIRQMRQGILSKRDPVELCTFIDETVFTRPVGGPRVMADQLRQVLSASDAANVTVRVLPRSLGAHAGLSGAFVLFEFVKARSVVYLEARRSGAFIDAPDDVAMFSDAVNLLDVQASDPTASSEILNEYVQQYESEAR